MAAILTGPFGIPAPFLVIAVATVLCLPVIARADVQETVDDAAPAARFAFDLLRSRPYVAAVVMGSAVFLMIGTFDALWVLALSDLDTADWIANLGITLFALPLVVLGPFGGRLAQRVGPYRLGAVGLLGGATFMFLYGVLPTGGAMFAVAMVHALNDGLTVSSASVAVGLVSPADRQAGAQGLLGGHRDARCRGHRARGRRAVRGVRSHRRLHRMRDRHGGVRRRRRTRWSARNGGAARSRVEMVAAAAPIID